MASIYKPLLHLWTLSVEEQYYVLWPLILLLTLKQRIVDPLYVIVFFSVISFLANVYFIDSYPDSVYFHTGTRIWQLASGSILSFYFLRRTLKNNSYLAYLGMVVILASAFHIDEAMAYPSWIALLPTIGAVIFILGCINRKNWFGMVGIGLISYPLYLWHWVLISFLTIYLGGKLGALPTLFAVICSFVLAYLTYKYIERIRYIKGPHIPVILFISVISVGIAGAYVKKEEGLPTRSHLSYLNELNVEFKRTPMTDPVCNEFAETLLGESRLFDYCRSNSLEFEKYIAVIGDSHAHVIYPGIADEAQRNNFGVILLANSSCPTLKGYFYGKTELEVENCIKKIDQILSIIKLENKVRKVFISTRGPVYVHGEVIGKFSEESVKESLNKIRGESQTYTSYILGLRSTIEVLQNTNSVEDIYYFLENPELDYLPKETIVRPFDQWGITIKDSSMDRDLYLLRMSEYRKRITSVASETANFKVLDPMPFLCDEKKCYSYKNGSFLYADDDHFSVFGSKYIAGKISQEIFYE